MGQPGRARSPGGSCKFAGSWRVAAGGPWGATGRGTPGAAAGHTGGAAGPPGTAAIPGPPRSGAEPAAGGQPAACSGCPPGISLTGAAEALMEEEEEEAAGGRGAAAARRARRGPQHGGPGAQAEPRPAAPPREHMAAPLPRLPAPRTWARRPGLPCRRREGGRGKGRAKAASASYCGGARAGPAALRARPCLPGHADSSGGRLEGDAAGAPGRGWRVGGQGRAGAAPPSVQPPARPPAPERPGVPGLRVPWGCPSQLKQLRPVRELVVP